MNFKEFLNKVRRKRMQRQEDKRATALADKILKNTQDLPAHHPTRIRTDELRYLCEAVKRQGGK